MACRKTIVECALASHRYTEEMNQVLCTIAEETACPDCHAPVPLSEKVCQSCDREMPTRAKVDDFIVGFFQGHIVDVRAGGLVIGRHGAEDDIPMFYGAGEGVLQLAGLMQGGEYIVNAQASAEYRDRLLEMNSFKSSAYTPMDSIKLTDGTRVFNTNGVEGSLLLLIDPWQFVMNRAATIKYYSELNEMNRSVSPWPTPAQQSETLDESGSSSE